jgi:excinuclease ABC subunit B
MYADKHTAAMDSAITLTNARRERQIAYNKERGIEPKTIRKAVGDILSILRPDETAPYPGKGRRQSRERDKVIRDLKSLGASDLERLIQTLEEEMHQAASDLHFEQAARLRDEIRELRRELREGKPEN